jgi:hypothetical protein
MRSGRRIRSGAGWRSGRRIRVIRLLEHRCFQM